VLLRTLVVILPASRDLLEPVLVAIAALTLLIAPLGAIAETNLRRAVGFMLIGGIGAVLAGIAMPSLAGVSGAGLYVFHAILTMTAFYLVAGLVERLTGEVDSRRMGGIYAASAPLSMLFFVMVLAIAGVPPFLGFWPKLLLVEAGIGAGGWVGGLLTGALLLNAVLTLIAGARLWAHIFWRPAPASAGRAPSMPDSGGWLRLGAAGAVAALVVVAGLWPNTLFEILRLGAPDLLDPARYTTAIGLAGALP
jgi:multicomponent Na+:H+ antiporter subunit D